MTTGSVARGAWRWIVAAMAMSGMREVTVNLGLVERPAAGRDRRRGRAPARAAIPVPHREVAIELAHWSYGAGMGVAYGVLPERLRRSPLTGPAFGVAIWAFFERCGADARLRSATRPPLAERRPVAADHLLYGAVVGGRPHGGWGAVVRRGPVSPRPRLIPLCAVAERKPTNRDVDRRRLECAVGVGHAQRRREGARLP